MSIKQEQEKSFTQKIGGFMLEIGMGQAVYWGKPKWAEKIGRRMRLSREALALTIGEAYMNAAFREDIIHGNHKRAAELREKALKIRSPLN